MIRAAASSSARCENACGKLPRCRPVSASNSSAYRPSGEAIRSSLLHQVARLLQLAHDRQRRDEPERADEEGALLAREAVVGLVGAVAEHEAVLGQLLGDRRDGRAQPLVVAAAGSRRSPRAGPRRRASRCRSAGAGRRVRRRRARGCRRGSPRRSRATSPPAPDRRGSRPAARRGRARPSTSASRRRSAAARRAPPRSPGRARARPSSRTRPATGRSATAAAAAARCAGCAAGSSRARRRRRRSGAGRRRRCRSARGARPRSRTGGRASTR